MSIMGALDLATPALARADQVLLDAIPAAIHVCAADGGILRYNRRASELWGRSPHAGDRYCGSLRLHQRDGRPLDHDASPMARVLRTGDPARDVEVVIERPDGGRRTVLVSIEPMVDDGAVTGAVACFQDVTERMRAEAVLTESGRRSRELLEALPAALYTTDAEGRITFYNEAAVAFSGRRPTLGSDEWCVTWRLYNTDGTPLPHDQCPMAVALREGRPIRGAEAIAERPDGTLVPFIPFPTPLHDASGTLIGAVNMLVDISERKRGEDQQKVLVDELNHRVKNTLATVQSIGAHTLRSAPGPAAFQTAFNARLMALSQAHELLTRHGWAGVQLREILAQQLSPFSGKGGPGLRLAGCDLSVAPRVGLALSMIFHELATNAAKHGALSVPGGGIEIDWMSRRSEAGEPATLQIDWTETGGPPAAAPARPGFGTRLIQRSVTRDLDGEVDLRFEPTGLRCRIRIPLQQR